ncbi:flagellar biosynthetic protein FliO [Trichloromonas sp.]|uniref:flagellar biosynthetic protein FliO n=1 Tax=Trichloromonas sp. TaxID=3069249 RepID=UPI002A4BCC01|nr:flagellar biosynthetic protein FliO [Trichloromonas sp.]
MRLMMKAQAILLLLATASPVGAEAVSGGGDLFIPWVKLIVALLLVLGLILLLYGASRKGFGLLPVARGGQIRVLEMRSLGTKKGVCLIRVRDEEFLLGLGGDRVELLARLEGPKTSFAETLEKEPGESS